MNHNIKPMYKWDTEIVELENGVECVIPSYSEPAPPHIFPFDIWKYSSLPNYNYKPKFLKWSLTQNAVGMLFRTGSVVITGIKHEDMIKTLSEEFVLLTSTFFESQLQIVKDSVKIKSIMCRDNLPTKHKYSPLFYENFFKVNPPKPGECWDEISFEPELRPAYYMVKYDAVTFLLFFSIQVRPAKITVFGKSLSKMNDVYIILLNLLNRL